MDESKSLQPGDVFRPNLISNYQVTVLEARNNGYLCAWIDDKGFHSDIWTKDDLKEVERTQYTAQVRELFNGDRAVYTNLGVFVQKEILYNMCMLKILRKSCLYYMIF